MELSAVLLFWLEIYRELASALYRYVCDFIDEDVVLSGRPSSLNVNG